jgi:ABC-type tungstate transport system permease subunit
MTMIAPSLASADAPSTLTVIGTSDVSDSGLIPNVIQPGFLKAYPQYAFKYIGTATGTAIANAESGADGASALIVHAESLENQFVAGGYSYERYGRSLWTNDFVLAGATGDPAGVAATGPHDIARAFAAVAAAGIAKKASFYSRGGTPGTTVEEHQIWHLVDASGLAPAGLLLCTVSATLGGGETPIATGGVSSNGQPCPKGGALPSALPDWYRATGFTQGPNVVAANLCTIPPSIANSCYVLTDRGTYDFLASSTDPADAIPALKIVSRDNSASAPGGAYALINYFHGYIINPSKPGQSVNLPAAQAFMNYITSAPVQAQVAAYLAKTSDPGGAPFKPTASPLLTSSRLPGIYRAAGGQKLTVTGTLTNAQLGYPVLSGEPVTVVRIVGGLPVSVASGRTDSAGRYSISFIPPATGSYGITTAQIAKIENATLNPPFGDLLSPSATTPTKVTVESAITELSSRNQGGQALIFGQVSPGNSHAKATVTLFARQLGSEKGYKKVATYKLGANDKNFAVVVKLASGKWLVQVKYADPGQVVAARTRTIGITVGSKPKTSVSFSSVKLSKGGSTTVSGTIKPAAPKSGATVEVLALKLNGGSAQFFEKAKLTVRSGKTQLSARFKLATGDRYVLRLVNHQTGQAPSDTGLKTVTAK